MEWWGYLLIIIGALLVVPYIGMTLVMPRIVFKIILGRTKPEKWSREEPSDHKDAEMLAMWDQSLAFRKTYASQEQELVAKTEDGLSIHSLYYDFGSDTAVILIPGRPESCVYSLFYAYPYAEKGVNVCAIDTRAHGLSEGKWSGCGYAEQFDILATAAKLHEMGIKKIILHGVCIGSSSLSFVLAREDLPSYIVAGVTDGLYVNFYETMHRRIRKNGGVVYPTIFFFRHWIKQLYGTDIKKEGPLANVEKIHVPMLMMASKEDIFSLPEKTQLLFDHLASTDKEMVWFDHGRHSHLRIVDHSRYDEAVARILAKVASL